VRDVSGGVVNVAATSARKASIAALASVAGVGSSLLHAGLKSDKAASRLQLARAISLPAHLEEKTTPSLSPAEKELLEAAESGDVDAVYRVSGSRFALACFHVPIILTLACGLVFSLLSSAFGRE
jgi:hypothetical protein